MAKENIDNFFNLDFKGKGHNSWKSNGAVYDVSISKIKQGFSLTFRNKCWEKLLPGVMIAVQNNRVFFKSDKSGWALSIGSHKDSQPAAKTTRYVKINNDVFDNFNEFIRDYDLKYFEPLNLYYIEKEDA